ncbi:hypothetical protein Tco_0417537 [Tanacetum coccineum]
MHQRFHGFNETVAREDVCGVSKGREDVREVFQQRGSGAKRKLFRCGRNQMGNEPILALPEGVDDFVVYYDARSKDLEACLEKGEVLPCNARGIKWIDDMEMSLDFEAKVPSGKANVDVTVPWNRTFEEKDVGGIRLRMVQSKERINMDVAWLGQRAVKKEKRLESGHIGGQILAEFWTLWINEFLKGICKRVMTLGELGEIIREVFVKLLLKSSGKLSIRHGLYETIVCYVLLANMIWIVVLERDRLKALMDFSLLRPAEDVIHYPRFTKLIIGDLMKKFDSIPKRLEEKYHFIKDNVPLEFVGVYVPMIQPQPVESTQGTHRIPRATRTPNLKDVVQKKRKSKQVVGEPSTPRKSLKKDVKKIVEGEDEESYASEFVDSVFLDEEDTSTRLELRSHKENLEIVDDDDVDEKRDDKKDDDDDNDDDNDDHDDHSLVRTRVTGTTISPTPATTSQDQSKPTSSKTKVLPGSIAQISSDACSFGTDTLYLLAGYDVLRQWSFSSSKSWIRRSSASALQILRTLGSIFTSVYAADQKLKKAYVYKAGKRYALSKKNKADLLGNDTSKVGIEERDIESKELSLPINMIYIEEFTYLLNKLNDTTEAEASI